MEEQSLIHEKLKKEEALQHIEREMQKQEKEIQHIEKSRTWKISNGYRKLRNFIQRITGSKQAELLYMQEKLRETERALYEANEQLTIAKIEQSHMNKNDIEQYMRKLKAEGKLVTYIDEIIAKKDMHREHYHTALNYAARLYMKNDDAEKHMLYEKIMAAYANEEIPEFMIRAGLAEPATPLTAAASFRGSLNTRMRRKQLLGTLPEWVLDDKQLAYQFVSQLDVSIPYVDQTHYQIANLPEQEGIVIKPADGAGSRGVYLIHSFDQIYDVKKSTPLTSWEQMLESMHADIVAGDVATDEWMIEQLIYENKETKTAARDIKFYCFYGEVGLILEIIREPEVRQCWWTRDGKRITTGKYDESLFTGQGVSEAEIEMVELLSAEIPSPFMRIDFLRAEEGLVFGEFTPKPGNYDEFDKQTDQRLGDAYITAEARLENDLYQGKTYTHFERIYNNQSLETK